MNYVACPTCRGSGTRVDPAIDGDGLTTEDVDELGGDDFLEDYFGGVYDVICSECEGLRVVPECAEPGCGEPVREGTFYGLGPDERPYSACYKHLSQDEREWADSEDETAAICAAERRMGA